jgi:hypothetical protein
MRLDMGNLAGIPAGNPVVRESPWMLTFNYGLTGSSFCTTVDERVSITMKGKVGGEIGSGLSPGTGTH